MASWSDSQQDGLLRVMFVSDEERQAFEEYAREFLKQWRTERGGHFETQTENGVSAGTLALSLMVDSELEDLSLRQRATKGIAYFRLEDGEPKGYIAPVPYTPQNVQALRERYPDLVQVVNEHLGMPFEDSRAFREREQLEQEYRRICETATVYTERDADTGRVRAKKVERSYSPELAKYLRQTRPNLVEIINERFLSAGLERRAGRVGQESGQ
ncbi:hypothetical protein D3C71_18490 [compost metagenome]